MSKIFFTKKHTPKELAAEIYKLIEDSDEIKENIDSDTDLTDPSTMEAMAYEVYWALKAIPKDRKDFQGVEGLEVDAENVSGSSDDFGESEFVGFHTLESGLTYWGLCIGGDREIPVHVALVHNGYQLMEVVPEDGNPFNTATMHAYGNDAARDMENATLRIIKEQFKDLTIDHLPEIEDEDDDDQLIEAWDKINHLIDPRVDLMLAELERDIVFFDKDGKEAGQMIEQIPVEDIKEQLMNSDLNDILRDSILDNMDAYLGNGKGRYTPEHSNNLTCQLDDCLAWAGTQDDLKEALDKINNGDDAEADKGDAEVVGALRKHFQDKLPEKFPLVIQTEDFVILYKPGSKFESKDEKGKNLDDANIEHEVAEFRKCNYVQRRLGLFQMAKEIEYLTKRYAALSEADVELMMEEKKAEEAAKKEEEDGDEHKGGDDKQ